MLFTLSFSISASIDNKELNTFPLNSTACSISSTKASPVLEIIFFRCQEKFLTSVELSGI